MKDWKCPGCNKPRSTEDDVAFRICNACQVEMEELKEDEGYGD